jgi:A/G-specific adenine glycosylase
MKLHSTKGFSRYQNMLDSKSKTILRRNLLKWFDANQRDLPWRKERTPYRIWVSEIMLQQTQVATVIPYYDRFMRQFPTVTKLAAADQSAVLKLWEGLGYYRRARQMHTAAVQVVKQHDGNFPTDFESVLALPGIGRYTAGAILSIALDQTFPILEGNTIRLFARLLGMKSNPRTSANQKILWEFAESILPKRRAGDFNQGLMELGSEICKPKTWKCETCPISKICPTFAQELQSSIPAAGKKVTYEDLYEAAILVSKKIGGQRKWLVRVCGPQERWTGLWDFPRFRIDHQKSETEIGNELSQALATKTGLEAELKTVGKPLRHAVTKYRIRLSCFETTKVTGRLKKQSDQTRWCTAEELAKLPMSVTGRKLVDRFL